MRELALAANQRPRLRRQIRRPRVERVERREGLPEALADELEDFLGLRQVLEAVRPEVAQPDALERLLGEQPAGRVRDENLAAMAGGADARGTMDADPDVSSSGRPGVAGVDPHPHSQLPALRPALGRERPLPVQGGRDSVARRGERDEERVALSVDLVAAVTREGIAQEAAVGRERIAVALPELVEKRRRPLDVREEKGDRSRAELAG